MPNFIQFHHLRILSESLSFWGVVAIENRPISGRGIVVRPSGA